MKYDFWADITTSKEQRKTRPCLGYAQDCLKVVKGTADVRLCSACTRMLNRRFNPGERIEGGRKDRNFRKKAV